MSESRHIYPCFAHRGRSVLDCSRNNCVQRLETWFPVALSLFFLFSQKNKKKNQEKTRIKLVNPIHQSRWARNDFKMQKNALFSQPRHVVSPHLRPRAPSYFCSAILTSPPSSSPRHHFLLISEGAGNIQRALLPVGTAAPFREMDWRTAMAHNQPWDASRNSTSHTIDAWNYENDGAEESWSKRFKRKCAKVLWFVVHVWFPQNRSSFRHAFLV